MYHFIKKKIYLLVLTLVFSITSISSANAVAWLTVRTSLKQALGWLTSGAGISMLTSQDADDWEEVRDNPATATVDEPRLYSGYEFKSIHSGGILSKITTWNEQIAYVKKPWFYSKGYHWAGIGLKSIYEPLPGSCSNLQLTKSTAKKWYSWWSWDSGNYNYSTGALKITGQVNDWATPGDSYFQQLATNPQDTAAAYYLDAMGCKAYYPTQKIRTQVITQDCFLIDVNQHPHFDVIRFNANSPKFMVRAEANLSEGLHEYAEFQSSSHSSSNAIGGYRQNVAAISNRPIYCDQWCSWNVFGPILLPPYPRQSIVAGNLQVAGALRKELAPGGVTHLDNGKISMQTQYQYSVVSQ